VDARKNLLDATEALRLSHDVDEIYSVRGKRIVHVDLKREKPDESRLRELLLGPTGNLRAPALRKGRILVVGFDRDTYERVFEGASR
jgi:hypothetical protein